MVARAGGARLVTLMGRGARRRWRWRRAAGLTWLWRAGGPPARAPGVCARLVHSHLDNVRGGVMDRERSVMAHVAHSARCHADFRISW